MILSDHRERPDDTESTSCSAQRTNSTRRVNALEAGGGRQAFVEAIEALKDGAELTAYAPVGGSGDSPRRLLDRLTEFLSRKDALGLPQEMPTLNRRAGTRLSISGGCSCCRHARRLAAAAGRLAQGGGGGARPSVPVRRERSRAKQNSKMGPFPYLSRDLSRGALSSSWES